MQESASCILKRAREIRAWAADSAQGPRAEIIEEDEFAGQLFVLPSAQDLREIGHLTEGEAAVERLEKIILVARQDKAGMEPANCGREMAAGIGQGDAEDGEVDGRL